MIEHGIPEITPLKNVDVPPARLSSSMGRVLSFATITAVGFVLGKVSGIAREMVVSAHFGLSAELDAYFLALMVPTAINNIVAGSAIAAAVVPTFARYLAAGERKEFWRVAGSITNVVLLVTGALTVLGMLLATPIMAVLGRELPASTQSLGAQLLVITMPTLLLSALLNMLMAVLNSVDRFTAPAGIFLALNLGIIGTVILLSPYIGVYAVAWGFLIGVGLQVVIQLIELHREHPAYTWRIDWHHPALRQVLMALIPITALSIVAEINRFVDRSMATVLPEGSISALYYADSILGAFYMLGISVGIAVYPSLSRSAAAKDEENTARLVVSSLRMLIFILVPLTLLLLPFGVPIIGLLLGRGKFDASAVQMTSQAFAMYAIGLIAIAALYVLQRAFYALDDNLTPFIVGLAMAGIHVVLNLALMQYWAHAGIALSTSVTAALTMLALILLLKRRIRSLALGGMLRLLLQCALLASISTVVVAWAFSALSLGDTVVTRVVGVVFVGVGALVYFALAYAFRLAECQMLSQMARRYLPFGNRVKQAKSQDLPFI